MRPLRLIAATLCVCLSIGLSSSEGFSKEGRGGGKGASKHKSVGKPDGHAQRGGKSVPRGASAGRLEDRFAPPGHDATTHPHRHRRGDADRFFSDPNSFYTSRNLRDEQLRRDRNRTVEERKLAHRQGVADHLRRISERNGNEHLKKVADQMERRAREHYEKRLEKIDSRARDRDPLRDEDHTLGDTAGIDEVLDGPDAQHLADDAETLDRMARKLTGRENALYRRLRNEERQLQRRLEAAERLRQMAASSGDEELLAMADQLEERAMSRYTQSLAKITEFQERFDLPYPDPAIDSVPPLP